MMFYVSILVTLLLGILLGIFLFRESTDINFRLLVNLFFPIGIGGASVIFISFNLLGFPFFLTCLLELALIVYLFFKIGKNRIKSIIPIKGLQFNQLFQTPVLLLITIVYFYAWIMDASIFFFDSIKEPHGLWDAWNYWNLKAKFISNAPDRWPFLFHQMVSEDFHIDYPLLQTGFIASCWLTLKNETVWVPILVAFVFTFCTIGLLSASVSYFTNKTKGLIAGLVLLSTPYYMVMGDSQYADNIVGFFFLATVVLLTFLHSQTSEKPLLYIAAGITAGLSAWSKNEGLLFIVCLVLTQLIVLPFKNFREALMEMKYFMYGILPILGLMLYYKMAIAPPNDIIKAQGEQTFSKLTDYSRYATVIQWYGSTIGTFGKWAFNPWWIFLAGIVYKGINIKKINTGIIANILLLFLMLTGFFFVYIVTPLNLEFHLSTSLHRLFFQLFPTFLFLYFILLGRHSVQNK